MYAYCSTLAKKLGGDGGKDVSGIYAILNKKNGKRYIGSSVSSVRIRFHCHIISLENGSHYNKHLQKAWNKYKPKAFRLILLEACSSNDCIKREQHWIDHYDASNRKYGYNLSPTAGSRYGMRHSDESRLKISLTLAGRKKNISPEGRIRMVESGKRNRGKKWTEEQKAKLKAIRAKLRNDPIWSAKRKRGLQNRLRSLKEKAKISLSMTKLWANPEFRKRRLKEMARTIVIHKERIKDPHLRARISRSVIAYYARKKQECNQS
jgi:group I intron endonuclease